jgi:hypothetical protein
MKRPYTANPGTNLISISLFNATPIKGVVVDNPSGGWLYIVELNDFVPPYTMAWARDLEYAGSALTIRYAIAPATQVSTQFGDPYTVTLYSDPVGASAGVPSQFIDQFNPIKLAFLTHTFTPGDVPTTFPFGTAVTGGTKRIRVHQVSLKPDATVSPFGGIIFTPIVGVLTTTAPSTPVMPDSRLRIAGSKTHDETIFVPYIDLPIGIELGLTLRNPTAAFLDASFYPGNATIDVELDVLYELI